MMSTTPTSGRRLALVMAAGLLLLVMLPAAPARADSQAFGLVGTAHQGCFSGAAVGTLNGGASANLTSYTGSLLTSDSMGELDLPGSAHDVVFTSSRVGATAVLTLGNAAHTGNAVLVFVPVGPPSLAPPCGSGPAAQVTGVGVLG